VDATTPPLGLCKNDVALPVVRRRGRLLEPVYAGDCLPAFTSWAIHVMIVPDVFSTECVTLRKRRTAELTVTGTVIFCQLVIAEAYPAFRNPDDWLTAARSTQLALAVSSSPWGA